NVPDANITQSSVVQHQAALTITESQISDLDHFSGSYTDLTDVPTSFPPSAHTHTLSEITDLDTTDDLPEGTTNLYFTQSRARQSISVAGDLNYSPTTGVISFNETYSTANQLLNAIKTVDGASSGLDSDLLDGEHG